MDLLKAMQLAKNDRNLVLYWDIETLAYNKNMGKIKPTLYKNVVYSVAIGFEYEGTIYVDVFPSFKSFFDTFFTYSARKDTINKSRTTITMIAHNCNKYDNHFLLHDLMYHYDIERWNMYMMSAENNDLSLNIKQAQQQSRDKNIVLEKRVKSSINLDLMFFLNGFKFTVIDNFMKTTTSIATLGKKLKDGGFLTDDDLKTDFDYTVFDRDDDMSEHESYLYAQNCFDKLNDEQMRYIINDVVILGHSHLHYSDIFPNFDYSKMTFSVNILESYLNKPITEFQLLNKIDKERISYTDFQFFGMNLYDYIKSFYRGGLNMYNPKYLATVVDDCFSIDINSSYPYVMYHNKIPTYLKSYDEFEKETKVQTDLDNQDEYTLYKMRKDAFNIDILMDIKSTILKKMLVKYYNNDKDYINLNTNTLRLIQTLTGLDLTYIYVMSYITFTCHYFGARDIIFDNYFIKTQGKLKNKIKMTSPYDYHITEEMNDILYSSEEIMLSKVILNGLYGIPALRSHFNLFRLDADGYLNNFINGYKNSERNILFSTFVTSQALFNLLYPLKDLTQQQIDDNFIYCDTDSLYLKSDIKTQIDDTLFDPIALGKWDIENEHIDHMYVLNHKKYAYVADKKIHVASAGIPLKSFNTDLSFDTFIAQEFHEGKTVYNQKSIYNQQKTISIYPSKTKIDKGNNYHTYFSKELTDLRDQLFKKIRKNYKHDEADDMLYIESSIGVFSFSDVFYVKHDYQNKSSIDVLKMIHDHIKKDLIG